MSHEITLHEISETERLVVLLKFTEKLLIGNERYLKLMISKEFRVV